MWNLKIKETSEHNKKEKKKTQRHREQTSGHQWGERGVGLPQWLSSEEPACDAGAAGDVGSILGSGRSPGGGNGNPLQYSSLEKPMDRGAWRATVHRVAKSRT